MPRLSHAATQAVNQFVICEDVTPLPATPLPATPLPADPAARRCDPAARLVMPRLSHAATQAVNQFVICEDVTPLPHILYQAHEVVLGLCEIACLASAGTRQHAFKVSQHHLKLWM
jgi:hypothetical protein